MSQACPIEGDLSAYGLGTLAPTDADGVERHLNECVRCLRHFDAIADNADELITGLRLLEEPDLHGPVIESTHAASARMVFAEAVRRQETDDTESERFRVSVETAEAGDRPQTGQSQSNSSELIPFVVDDVKRCLLENGLVEPAEVEEAARTFTGSDDVNNAVAFVKHLTERGSLTCFQATEICLGRGANLRIDAYIIEEKVGRGGMGTVFRARHETMQRTVALKVLFDRLFDQPETLERFRREALAVGRISHSNVVSAFDAGDDAGTRYIVCEYVDGVTLSGLVDAIGPLPLELAADFVRQAAIGLQAAHEQGVIHRDVKPSNLLVTRQGHVKVADLGLVRFVEETSGKSDLTERGRVLGTLDYISPEQAFGNAPVEQQSDIYSLGWTLYFLLTANTAFPDRTQFSKLVAHRDSPIPSLEECVPGIPEFIDRLFHRMVAKRREDRPQSMAEVIEILSNVASPPADRTFALAIPDAEVPQLDSFFDDLDIKMRGLHEVRRLQLERRKRKTRNAAITVLIGVLLFAGGLTYFFKNSTAEIAVKFDGTFDKNVKIRVYEGDQEVAVLNHKNEWTASLGKGNYSLIIAKATDGSGARPESATIKSLPPKKELAADDTTRLIGETARLDVSGSLLAMALSPDHQTAFVSVRDNQIYFIDVSTRKIVKKIRAHTAPASLLAVSRDGTRLASYSGGARTLRVWDIKTGNRLQHIPLPTFLLGLVFGPERDRVLAAVDMQALVVIKRTALDGNRSAFDGDTEYRSLMECNIDTGQFSKPFTNDKETRFHSLAISDDGNTVVAGTEDGAVHVFDRKQQLAVRKFSGHGEHVRAVRLSNDGQRVYSVGITNLILCHRLSDGKVEYSQRFQNGFIGIDINRDESAFLFSNGVNVSFFDRNEPGDRNLTLLHGHTSFLRGLYFLADESRAISCSNDGTVRFWKLPHRQAQSPE